jgi:hypothetical protein
MLHRWILVPSPGHEFASLPFINLHIPISSAPPHPPNPPVFVYNIIAMKEYLRRDGIRCSDVVVLKISSVFRSTNREKISGRGCIAISAKRTYFLTY